MPGETSVTTPTGPLPRNSMIGIVGGGQLGRMLAMAAARLGLRTTVLDPAQDPPAAQCANRHLRAAYDDRDALMELARHCAVITYEFENADAQALGALDAGTPVWPPVSALAVSQDRLAEKQFLQSAGLPVARFADITNADDLHHALAHFGGRGFLKTRRFGYDGKGQVRFTGGADDPAPADALATLGNVPAILEEAIAFDCEISVIATRSHDGTIVCFDPARNRHADGILATSTVPCGLSAPVIATAIAQAGRLAGELAYVGTLGLEFFVLPDGSLMANEFAPRVHNSGHWTEAACSHSQFEMHVRAIARWPLPKPVRHSNCLMENLLGDSIDTLAGDTGETAVIVHDYGKPESRPGRKMGHLTRLTAPATA